MKPTPRELWYDYKQTYLDYYKGCGMPYNGLTIFYNPRENCFVDEDGYVLYDLYEHVPTFVIQEYYHLRCPRYFLYDVDDGFQIEIIWDADAWEESEG